MSFSYAVGRGALGGALRGGIRVSGNLSSSLSSPFAGTSSLLTPSLSVALGSGRLGVSSCTGFGDGNATFVRPSWCDPRLTRLYAAQAQNPQFNLFLTASAPAATVPQQGDIVLGYNPLPVVDYKATLVSKVLPQLLDHFAAKKARTRARKERARRLFRSRRRLFQVRIFRAARVLEEKRTIRRQFKEGPLAQLLGGGFIAFRANHFFKQRSRMIEFFARMRR